jgi:hypothetical protein
LAVRPSVTADDDDTASLKRFSPIAGSQAVAANGSGDQQTNGVEFVVRANIDNNGCMPRADDTGKTL